jgi:hypothetical protein
LTSIAVLVIVVIWQADVFGFAMGLAPPERAPAFCRIPPMKKTSSFETTVGVLHPGGMPMSTSPILGASMGKTSRRTAERRGNDLKVQGKKETPRLLNKHGNPVISLAGQKSPSAQTRTPAK